MNSLTEANKLTGYTAWISICSYGGWEGLQSSDDGFVLDPLSSGLHPDGRVGVTEEELEEIVQAVQEDADNATDAEAAAQAVGALTTEASFYIRQVLA